MDKLMRKLPIFKGKEKLSRILFSGIINSKKNIEIVGRYGCKFLIPNISESIGFNLFINGTYEPDIQEIANKLLPKNGCLIDAGANIGSIVIPLAKIRPDIKAVAVEAAPWIFSYLQKNVTQNNADNIVIVNNALLDVDDKELDFYSPKDNFGQGSFAKVANSDVVKVKTKKLDTIIQTLNITKVDVIKVDVEGFEYFVFKGATELLKRSDAPCLIFEFGDLGESKAPGLESGSAQQFLIDLGYKIYEIRGTRLIKKDGHFTSGYYNLVASKKDLN